MMDTATPATARFRDDELLEITSIASPWIDAGLWSGLHRTSTPEYDRIAIHPAHGMAHYLLQRDPFGSTSLLYVLPDDLRLLEIGSLSECLRIFSLPTLQ
jgi:hypothetical protein